MKRALLVSLCVLMLTPAGARTATSSSITISPSAHRASGTACSSGGRYCAGIGCAVAPVLPVTTEEIQTVPYSSCKVNLAIVIAGVVKTRGKPAGRIVVIGRSLNKDDAQCWPDTWLAALASCKTKIVRPPRAGSAMTDSKGRFSLTLPADSYQAGHMELPVDAIRSCKDIPVNVLLRARDSITTKTATLHACA